MCTQSVQLKVGLINKSLMGSLLTTQAFASNRTSILPNIWAELIMCTSLNKNVVTHSLRSKNVRKEGGLNFKGTMLFDKSLDEKY